MHARIHTYTHTHIHTHTPHAHTPHAHEEKKKSKNKAKNESVFPEIKKAEEQNTLIKIYQLVKMPRT
jgi:hypothetical protein